MPGHDASAKADALRAKALEHPTVKRLATQLPTLPEGEPDEGLYVETHQTPGLVVNGELRVSVARVFTVDDEGATLIGQIQAVRTVDHPLAQWEIRCYKHTPQHFHTEHFDDVQAWFVDVLEQHYKASDAEPALETGIEA